MEQYEALKSEVDKAQNALKEACIAIGQPFASFLPREEMPEDLIPYYDAWEMAYKSMVASYEEIHVSWMVRA